MLYCVLVAGPDEVLFGRKGLAVLHDPKFSLGDLTDHSVHHHLIFGSLRTRLNDDVTQRDSLEAGGLWMVPRHRHGSRHPAPLSCPYSSWFAQRQASIAADAAANPIANADLRST